MARDTQTGKTHGKLILAIVALGVVMAVAGGLGLMIILRPKPVTLEQEYYQSSEMLSLNKAEYEELLAQKKSFVVLVDNPGCTTTQRMREMMANFPDELDFSYYQFMWPEVEKSSLHEYVKYYPSVVIIDDGRVAYYLRADADEDARYYNSAEDLKNWLKQRIDFN